ERPAKVTDQLRETRKIETSVWPGGARLCAVTHLSFILFPRYFCTLYLPHHVYHHPLPQRLPRLCHSRLFPLFHHPRSLFFLVPNLPSPSFFSLPSYPLTFLTPREH